MQTKFMNIPRLTRQLVGIIYEHKDWADQMYDKIYRGYADLGLVYSATKENQYTIELKDGSLIAFVSVGDCLGYQFDKVLVERRLDRAKIRRFVEPTLAHYNYDMIFELDNDGEDIRFL